jgi:hypothetical protein
VRRAEAAGYGAIVLTIDAAIKLAGMALPAGVAAVNLAGQAPVRQARLGGAAVFGTPLADAAPRWEDLAWLRAQNAPAAAGEGHGAGRGRAAHGGYGVDGLILSNHGGRVLDGLPPVPEVLPALRAAVGALPVLVDGGFRRGTDVKALALGADAVLLGRAQLHGLAVAGVAGVAHGLHLLRTELEMAMAALGCHAGRSGAGPSCRPPERLRFAKTVPGGIQLRQACPARPMVSAGLEQGQGVGLRIGYRRRIALASAPLAFALAGQARAQRPSPPCAGR